MQDGHGMEAGYVSLLRNMRFNAQDEVPVLMDLKGISYLRD